MGRKNRRNKELEKPFDMPLSKLKDLTGPRKNYKGGKNNGKKKANKKAKHI